VSFRFDQQQFSPGSERHEELIQRSNGVWDLMQNMDEHGDINATIQIGDPKGTRRTKPKVDTSIEPSATQASAERLEHLVLHIDTVHVPKFADALSEKWRKEAHPRPDFEHPIAA
jgi:hypothetical protein